MSSFELVSTMNTAFGNPKGVPIDINWTRVRKQTLNIGDEFVEMLTALGASNDEEMVLRFMGALNRSKETGLKAIMHALKASVTFTNEPDLEGVRDASRDVVVFADGVHHFMGINADRDMVSVITGVMSRFIKDDADKEATIAKHAAAGVTDVYFEGDYPTMIMKSAKDQPDAPQGKFLKSASYKEAVFYDVTE